MGGILSWGPQPKKGTVATTFYRHKATLVDFGVADDVRLGPPEVGGTAVPTFPYKAGPLVGGGLTIQPRLEGTAGWLLHGLLGSYSASAGNYTGTTGGSPTGMFGNTNMITGGSPVVNAAPVNPPTRYLVMPVYLFSDITSGSPKILISGSSGSAAVNETMELGGRSSGSHFWFSGSTYQYVGKVELPAVSGSVSMGWLADHRTAGSIAFAHLFQFDADTSKVPWMTFRKAIPKRENNPATDIGEIYLDCKALSAAWTFPNDGPIGLRLDMLGRSFTFDYAPDLWTYANTFEDYTTIPIGCVTSGYIQVGSDATLPIVAATVTFANVPLDTRQERVYGDPFIEDITILQRTIAFDLLVKWNNPNLYAQVLTGGSSGSAWTSAPFTAAVTVYTEAPDEIGTLSGQYHSLMIYAPSVMLALNGTITLASNQAIMMRFTGSAIDPGGTTQYCTFTLKNQYPHYMWPYAY